MSKEQNKGYYDNHLIKYIEVEVKYYELYEKAIQYLYDYKLKTIVDIGCGIGSLEKFFYDNGFKKIRGIDFSTFGINYCKKRHPYYKFLCGDLFSNEILNFIREKKIFSCLEVLEHLDKDIELIQNLQPGSIFVFSVPSVNGSGHVRSFQNQQEVIDRYSSVLEFKKEFMFECTKLGKPHHRLFLFKTIKI